jgi:hypothetical protein
MYYVHYDDLILKELDYIVTISFGYVLYYVYFHLYTDGFKLFCNVCVYVCVSFVMGGCPDNVYTLNLFGYPDRFFRAFSSVVREMPGLNSQTWHGRHSSTFVVCVVLFVILIVLLLICCSVYCFCVNVYCTTATGCQPNCS